MLTHLVTTGNCSSIENQFPLHHVGPRGIASHNQNHFSHLGKLPLTGLVFNYSFRELAFTCKA